jgi:Tol biopolymer transport system component
MPLESGARLGPYAVVAQIGAGGMGEVYKATDTRLNRTVAVKVLPAHFSHDHEMKQRFDREAQTIAGLNHPHICILHDVGRASPSPEAEPVDYLVMEYLEGETLADRLARGGLPLDEALPVAIEIADALEKAHAKGVTHRDLKPGNVMLTGAGAKLLDFGLAKLRQQAPVSQASSLTVPVSPSATTPGTILGTMQYMSPEQLEGLEADARTDLFAFGAVLYEMVTGRKAFQGKSQPHLIAAIVSTQPDPIAKALPSTPPALDFLVRRCLEKNPDERLQTAVDLVQELRWIKAGSTRTAPVATSRRRITPARIALAAAVVLALVTAGLALTAPGATGPTEATRFTIDVPEMPVPEAVAISPDGRTVAYSGRDGGSTAVFVRPLDVGASQKLPGSEGAGRLFWSPDSRWIAFFAGGRLKRVEAAGGPAQNVSETPDLLGGSWNADGDIVFGSKDGLHRVLAAGGQPTAMMVTADGKPLAQPREPYFLPDGRHFLFLAGSGDKDGDAAIYAAALDSPDATRVVAAASNPAYVEPGYLLYHRDGTLYAQPFDAGARSLRGDAVRITDGLPIGASGAAAFAVSSGGVLVYRNNAVRQVAPAADTPTTDTGIGTLPPLLWATADGNTEAAGGAARWIGVDLSPNGRQFAAHRHDSDGGDIWVFDVGEQTPTRLTFDAGQDNSMPVWTPDGRSIAFASRRNGKWGLYTKLADNSRAEELVVETEFPAMPMSWSPDGKRLVYSTRHPKTAADIWNVSLDGQPGKGQTMPLLETDADERTPQVSPDGRWLAYSSNETGRSEIYIRPYPDGPGRIQVSVNGGVYPRWRRDGQQIFFLNLLSAGGMMTSDVRVTGASIQRSVPRRLFQSNFVTQSHAGGAHHAYAVSADGQRFLIPQFDSIAGAFGNNTGLMFNAIVADLAADRRQTGAGGLTAFPITVVLDWTAAVRR